jgi:hypothetical protein
LYCSSACGTAGVPNWAFIEGEEKKRLAFLAVVGIMNSMCSIKVKCGAFQKDNGERLAFTLQNDE